MPRVPTYDSFQAQPGTLPNVAVRAPDVQDFAGEQAQRTGQGMQRLGGDLGRIALDAAQEANQVRVNDAMNRAVQAKLKLTYDQAEGFVHLRGDAALTRPDGKPLDEEFGGKFEKTVADIEASLGNDAQKLAFRQQAGQVATQFRGSLQQHVAREFTEYKVGVQQGTIATARDQMALAWGDAAAVEQSVGAIKAAVAEQGRLKGWSGQQVTAAMVEVLSPGHAAVVGGAIDAGKLDYAREYMKQVNAELTPAARLQLTKALDAGDFETRAQTATEKYLTQAGGDVNEALKLARANLTGKDEDAVVTRIKAIDAERVVLRERDQKDAGDQAWRVYASTGALGKIPPSVIARMDGRDLEALRRTARVDAEAAANRAQAKTDPSVYYALTVAAATDPNFKSTDLRAFFDKLSPTDRKHFMDLQGKAMKPDEEKQVATTAQQISAMTKTLGFKDEQAGLFTMEANKALSAAQSERGRPLTLEERQKVLDRLVLEGEVVTGQWWRNDPNMRLFEAQSKGQAGQFRPTWGEDQIRKATSALQRQGVATPTREQIEATLRAAYGIKN